MTFHVKYVFKIFRKIERKNKKMSFFFFCMEVNELVKAHYNRLDNSNLNSMLQKLIVYT